jgi:uncharacterized protein Yka (UPF0111/DUF47 family)
MVAKRDLSARFSPEVQKQPMRQSQGQYAVKPPAPNSYSNYPVSAGGLTPATNSQFGAVNDYSEAVAHSVQRKREQFYRAKATESVIVIAVNVALSIAAIAAIVRLLPYQIAQKERLDEIITEVNSVEQRVSGLREQLPQTLNSGKSQEPLLRKQGWIKNNQMTIKLLDPTEIASPNNDGVMPTTTTAQRTNNR